MKERKKTSVDAGIKISGRKCE